MRRWWGWCNGKVAVTISCWAMSIFISQICPPKWLWKSAFYRNIWNSAAGQRQLWRHWKLLGMKVLIKHFKESYLAPETMLRTQRSHPFPKLEKLLIFGILAKGGLHENFWKASIIQMAESDIHKVECGADDDCAMKKWLRLIFVELWAFLSRKFYFQNGLEKVLFTATIGMPHRANGDCDVIESYLKWRSWSSTSRESGLAPETMLRTQRSRPFLKLQKLLIFGILAKGRPHENFLESFNSTNG